MLKVPMSIWMPTMLMALPIALTACAPVVPAESSSDAGSSPEATSTEPADAATNGGEQSPAEAGAGAVEGGTGTGTVQPVPPEQIRVAPGLGEDSCKADAAQAFVGRSNSEAVVKDAVRASGAKTVRVIPEGGAVTMDYRGDRLNIQLDAQGKIVAITCG
jgi:hypothetical protein